MNKKIKLNTERKVIAFNGTYNYDTNTGTHFDPTDMLGQSGFHTIEYRPISIGKLNSFYELSPIFEALKTAKDVVVFLGTDSIEEVAFFFSLNRPPKSRVSLIGSMLPFGHSNYDGHKSIHNFIKSEDLLSEGSWVFVGEILADGSHVRKINSVGPGAIYPMAIPFNDGIFYSRNDPLFCVSPNFINQKVAILTVSMGDDVDWVNWNNLDGVVIAGSGTGSVSKQVLDSLKKGKTNQRIIISTRCMDGPNNAEELYPKSVKPYEDLGFEVTEFSGLNPLQARIKLLLELANT